MAITRTWDESGLLMHYISDKTNTPLRYDGVGFMVFDGDKFLGGIAGTEFNRTRGTHQCQVVWAAETPRWFTLANMRAFYDKAFDELGLTRLNGRISANNTRSIRAAERYGFVVEGTLRQAGDDGEDLVVLGLTKDDDCKSKRGATEDDNPGFKTDKSVSASPDRDHSDGQ